MRLTQLRDHLNALLAAGVDPATPVCVHDTDPVCEAWEVANTMIIRGPFREDPSPKLCGYLHSNGVFLLLMTSVDYDEFLNSETRRVEELNVGVEAPEKTWPNGHWFSEPRRPPGQP